MLYFFAFLWAAICSYSGSLERDQRGYFCFHSLPTLGPQFWQQMCSSTCHPLFFGSRSPRWVRTPHCAWSLSIFLVLFGSLCPQCSFIRTSMFEPQRWILSPAGTLILTLTLLPPKLFLGLVLQLTNGNFTHDSGPHSYEHKAVLKALELSCRLFGGASCWIPFIFPSFHILFVVGLRYMLYVIHILFLCPEHNPRAQWVIFLSSMSM